MRRWPSSMRCCVARAEPLTSSTNADADAPRERRFTSTIRSSGRIELARLDLGGLQPVEEGTRDKVLKAMRDAFQPAPAPAPPTGPFA